MREDVAKAITVVETLLADATEAPEWQAPQVTAEDRANLDHVLAVLRGIDPPVELGPPRECGSEDEVPWFSEPTEARLVWQTDWTPSAGAPADLGHLAFWDPEGNRAMIPVTHGPDMKWKGEGEFYANVWHVDEHDDGVLVVSPSVHFIGYWHSPNPVRFRRVDDLPGWS